MFVTSGQTLLAVAIMLNLKAHLWEAGLLFFLFVAQFFFPSKFPFLDIDAHYVFGTIYMALFFILAFPFLNHVGATLKAMFNFRKPRKKEIASEKTKPGIELHG
jgi:hypothetical protein